MSAELFERYQELQQYVGWSEEDAERVRALAHIVEPSLGSLIDDFYAEIDRHPAAKKVITGGPEQVERLKGTLIMWLRELLSGRDDADYVARRWRVGYRHVEIGLDQVYTNVALSRLRTGLQTIFDSESQKESPKSLVGTHDIFECKRSLNKLLDLDLAIIEDAYQAEYLRRQQQAERMAAIGQVAGGIAHELRNPLNVIKTSVYFLLNARTPSPEKTAEHLVRIEKQVGLADGVITALSNFAKMPIPTMEPFAVEPFLNETLENVLLPNGIKVVIDCPPTVPSVLGDRAQMQIVFSNLFRNARDAMGDAGCLAIATSAKDGEVEVRVSDTGHGIEPQNLERVMEPLYSTKTRGIGLGLPMARAIVNKNQGNLSVKSAPGQGATFTVRLRAAEPVDKQHVKPS